MDEKKVKDFFRAVYVERGYKDLNEIKMSWSVVSIKYSLNEIVRGLNWITDNIDRRPNSTHFKKALEVDIDVNTTQAIQHLEKCLKRHGHTGSKNARKFLGEQLWAAIGYSGGYQAICRNYSDDKTYYKHEIKKQIKASFENPKGYLEALPQSKEVKELLTETLNKLGERNE